MKLIRVIWNSKITSKKQNELNINWKFDIFKKFNYFNFSANKIRWKIKKTRIIYSASDNHLFHSLNLHFIIQYQFIIFLMGETLLIY